MVKKVTWLKGKKWEKTQIFKRLILKENEWIKSSIIRINFRPSSKISSSLKSI
jgi:hypothetical protein